MSRDVFPRWVGTASIGMVSGRRTGCASLVVAPGKVTEQVRCSHNHRSTTPARECGQRMAESRNKALAR